MPGKDAILLEKYKAIYILVPKVATSSMKKVCLESLGINWDGKDVHLATLPYISKEEVLRNKYDSYFKFSFVRDPWNRIVSCYEDKINDKKIKPAYNGQIFRSFRQYQGMRVGMSFKEFVEVVAKIPDRISDVHFRSQYDLLSTVKEKNRVLIPDSG